MGRLLVAATLGVVAISRGAIAQSRPLSKVDPDVVPLASSVDLPQMPPAPRGKSTIFGGEITNLDPVRDRLTLRLPAQRAMTIFFDERTQIYRNGKRIRLTELGSARNASIETTLDGSRLFAVSIHLLSDAQEGQLQGRVMSFDAATGQLRVAIDGTAELFSLIAGRDTQIVREGQAKVAATSAGSSDLVNGALVSLDFTPSGKGTPAAREIHILALPGMGFTFQGKVSSLDVHLGRLVLVDPRDQQSYQLFFDAASLPAGQTVHLEDDVRVTANYDGTHYVAHEIEVNKQ